MKVYVVADLTDGPAEVSPEIYGVYTDRHKAAEIAKENGCSVHPWDLDMTPGERVVALPTQHRWLPFTYESVEEMDSRVYHGIVMNDSVENRHAAINDSTWPAALVDSKSGACYIGHLVDEPEWGHVNRWRILDRRKGSLILTFGCRLD